MLKGIVVETLARHFDERGSFTELMRKDWKSLLNDEGFVQSNLSISHPGIIRAWHKHLRSQIDFFVCLLGSIKICAYDDEKRELNEIIVSGDELKVVRIPGHYWHGFKVIGSKPAWVVYFVNNLYDSQNPDEERRPWDDQTIIPLSINGKMNDHRVKKPWNWFESVHK
jgi:dTDP-4-dehydrorhamnose 3,5-epimerase